MLWPVVTCILPRKMNVSFVLHDPTNHRLVWTNAIHFASLPRSEVLTCYATSEVICSLVLRSSVISFLAHTCLTLQLYFAPQLAFLRLPSGIRLQGFAPRLQGCAPQLLSSSLLPTLRHHDRARHEYPNLIPTKMTFQHHGSRPTSYRARRINRINSRHLTSA